jgi:protein-tyrosine kinase
MSRIDQALAKGLPEAVPTANDAAAENPWDLSASVAPPDAEAPDVAMRVPLQSPSGDSLPAEKVTAPDLGRRLGRGDVAEKIVGSQLPPDVVEEYRRLAALLHQTQIERSSQVLMISSAVAGEGKTLTATNLALTLSGSYGRNVLLVDADLRRPSLHQMFNVANASGLSDLLTPDSTATPSLTAISPRLTLLTAGRPDPDPMAALTSTRMKQLIDEAKAGFDWVIIDTPPVGLLTDASLLAQMVDLALLVVRAESTPFEQVQRAADAIGRHRITGVVLNRVSKTALGEASRYTDYYSSYSTVDKS